MSFEIAFQTCNLSDKTEEIVNPFTGETIEAPVGECVTEDERRAVSRLLATAGAPHADDFGCYTPGFSDGSSAEVFFDGLSGNPEFGGGTVALRGISEEICRFLYELAAAGNFAILPAMEGDFVLVTSAKNAERIASRWPEATVIDSPDDLHRILIPDHRAN